MTTSLKQKFEKKFFSIQNDIILYLLEHHPRKLLRIMSRLAAKAPDAIDRALGLLRSDDVDEQSMTFDCAVIFVIVVAPDRLKEEPPVEVLHWLIAFIDYYGRKSIATVSIIKTNPAKQVAESLIRELVERQCSSDEVAETVDLWIDKAERDETAMMLINLRKQFLRKT
ncbi:hypothetical protein GF367_01560 [Candidatus Woesearchaeota archaeon]|nr:hypothetical protein [Candidatus Woesearchaeota archaeon]